MVLISKDIFKFQIEFAKTWSKKNSLNYDKVLFENTFLYVRLLGYSDVNRPSINNTEWQNIINNKPLNTEEQTEYFFNKYVIFEKNKNTTPPTRCFSYNYHPLLNIFELHFVNADPKGNFARERTNIRIKELRDMFQEIKNKNHNEARVKIGTWMLNIDAFKRIFPIEFTQNATFLDTKLTQNYTHWGQFLTKEGNLKQDIAKSFIDIVKNRTYDHINKYFPHPALVSFLELNHFYKFYGIN